MKASYRLTIVLILGMSSTITLAGNPVIDPDDPLPVRDDAPEHIPGVTTYYSSVAVDAGTRLRVLVTRPEGHDAPLQPLFVSQWVSCGSALYVPGRGSSETFAHLARYSGLALVRVERSGSGDSTGLPCSQLDYDTELEHYRIAFDAVLRSGQVDTSRLFFLGVSLGSTTAPLLAGNFQDRGYQIGGVAVQGGGAYSYLERMLAFEQHYIDRRTDATDGEDRTLAYQQRVRFMMNYLVEERHPDEIAADSDAMAAVRKDILGMDATHHYGRPFRWHQQAASYDFVEAWSALSAPVLVIYNAFDQFESEYGARLLADTVNASQPGAATLIIEQQLDHNSRRYDSAINAYANEGGTGAWDLTAAQLAVWYRGLQQ